MSAKFPLSGTRTPGSVYKYDPDVNEKYIDEAVITNKNFEDAYKEILKTNIKSENDVYSTKVRVNPNGIIVDTDDLKAIDLPAHTHESAEQGGQIQYKQQLYELDLLPDTVEYTIPSGVHNTLFGMYINGSFYTDYTKEEDYKIKLLFDIDQNCKAQLVYY